MRLARLCVFSPAVGALAAVVTTGQRRRSGAERALASLGSASARGGAAGGATALGLVAAASLLTPLCDVTSLFPTAPSNVDWVAIPDGFVERGSGTLWTPDGFARAAAPVAAHGTSMLSRWAAFLCAAPLALTLPTWACQDHAAAPRWIAALLTISLVVLYLHAHATGRAGAVVGAACVLPIALQTLAGAARSGRGLAPIRR